MKDILKEISGMETQAARKVPDLQPWSGYYRLRARELEVLFSMYAPKKFGTILEIGCGNGFTSAILSKFGERIVATDLCRTDIRTHSVGIASPRGLFRSLAVSNCEPVSCSAEGLPFKDGSFDFVFCAYTLEHISRRAEAVKEIKRVMKAGAEAVVIVPGIAERLLYPFCYYTEILKRAFRRIFKNSASGASFPASAAAKKAPEPAWKKFRDDYPHFPFPDPHGEYPDYFTELAGSFPNYWSGMIRKNGLVVKDVFTTMLFPKAFFSIFVGAASLGLYIKTMRMNRRLGRNFLLKYLGENSCFILERRDAKGVG